ncbi:MAG: nonstructural protein [Microviridae sp.]|nr:MAG: nonstructural protein [Microviridae sp.]
MPKMRIYSVYDEKAEEFSPPFFQQNDRLAQRMITESCKGNGSMLAAYPEDFKLYRLGEFESSTGEITPEQRPNLLLCVKDLTKGRQNNVEN